MVAVAETASVRIIVKKSLAMAAAIAGTLVVMEFRVDAVAIAKNNLVGELSPVAVAAEIVFAEEVVPVFQRSPVGVQDHAVPSAVAQVMMKLFVIVHLIVLRGLARERIFVNAVAQIQDVVTVPKRYVKVTNVTRTLFMQVVALLKTIFQMLLVVVNHSRVHLDLAQGPPAVFGGAGLMSILSRSRQNGAEL